MVHISETKVPGRPTSLRVRPLSTSIVVSWTPPVEQDIMIRGYVLGYGVGIPDVYRQVISPRQRYYAVKSLRETVLLFLFELRRSKIFWQEQVSNFRQKTRLSEWLICGFILSSD